MENLWYNLENGWRLLTERLTPSVLSEPITDPVPVFLTIMAIMLIAPLLFERLKLPGIVGLILAGVVVGPHGLGLLQRDSTIVLLGTVGLLFLMFMAGLETSLDDLKYNADKAVIFGLATFAMPMVLGTVAMLLLGYGFLAAILVASCFASHTLLALPVVTKLGIMRSQAVTATLGGTLITNVLALLVLAIVVKAQQGNLTLNFWLFLIPSLSLYTFATLWGVTKLGRWFFRRFGHDEGAEFTFVLATLFVVSYGAELIEIEPIIGAFLAGIAITQLIPQLSPLMNRIQFIGNTLFVPFFLISVGMLINPIILVSQPQSLLVAGVMILAEVASKFLAAWAPGKFFRLHFPDIMVMFGLSVAQAASTLAAITVAYEIKLVDQPTVNGIITMILFTCIASPWITSRWGANMKLEVASSDSRAKQQLGERVLVPVANPNTEDNLLQLALILAKSTGGTLLPLHILTDNQGQISAAAKARQRQLLMAAETIAHAAVTPVEPIGRVDDSVDKGILRTAEERNANLIVCGWKGYSTTRENFFGSVIDKVVHRATVPVLVAGFTQPIENINRIFLAFSEREASSSNFRQTVVLAQTLAVELKASLQLLQIRADSQRASLNLEASGINPDIPIQRVNGNVVGNVYKLLKPNDLLLLKAGNHFDMLGLSSWGVLPASIARISPSISRIIIYFPSQNLI
ncbi:MAG TPA: cation:proton antiporter [Cyanobacteria bacterium UBA11049]|nr:cation:proton antiporter [Cyanobacteria bacterium UBA11049]